MIYQGYIHELKFDRLVCAFLQVIQNLDSKYILTIKNSLLLLCSAKFKFKISILYSKINNFGMGFLVNIINIYRKLIRKKNLQP